MAKHTLQARKLLQALDADLAAASEETGDQLVWTHREQALLDRIAATVDRRVEIEARYREAASDGAIVKLSNEIRQCDTMVTRLVGMLKIDAPQPKSVSWVKTQRAATIRWERARRAGEL